MDEKFEAVLTSPLDGLICVDRTDRESKVMPDGRKEATQDMYIVELQRESERTRTMLEHICEDLKSLRSEQKEVLEAVNTLASDERAARVATDMRIEKVENGLTTAHARIDDIHDRVTDLERAPGNKAQKTISTFWKDVGKYGIAGAVMLLLLGIKEWIKQNGGP